MSVSALDTLTTPMTTALGSNLTKVLLKVFPEKAHRNRSGTKNSTLWCYINKITPFLRRIINLTTSTLSELKLKGILRVVVL
jgi:hypothetical protein